MNREQLKQESLKRWDDKVREIVTKSDPDTKLILQSPEFSAILLSERDTLEWFWDRCCQLDLLNE